MHVIHELTGIIGEHIYVAYFLLLIGIIIEGELMIIVSGILVHLGVLPILSTLIVCLAGAMGKTFIGYGLGVFLDKKIPKNKFFEFIERKVLYILPHFKERPFWSIVVSKFVYGFNNFVIIFAGYIRADFRTFVEAELLSTIVWLPALFSIGYFASGVAFGWNHSLIHASLAILCMFVGLIVLQQIINNSIEYFEE